MPAPARKTSGRWDPATRWRWYDAFDMGRVGRYVQLKAREGQRDALVEHMLGVLTIAVRIICVGSPHESEQSKG